MCGSCGWEDYLEEIAATFDAATDLPDRAADFADSVTEKLEGIAAWVEEHEHVTEAQKTAVANMAVGVWRMGQREGRDGRQITIIMWCGTNQLVMHKVHNEAVLDLERASAGPPKGVTPEGRDG